MKILCISVLCGVGTNTNYYVVLFRCITLDLCIDGFHACINRLDTLLMLGLRRFEIVTKCFNTCFLRGHGSTVICRHVLERSLLGCSKRRIPSCKCCAKFCFLNLSCICTLRSCGTINTLSLCNFFLRVFLFNIERLSRNCLVLFQTFFFLF